MADSFIRYDVYAVAGSRYCYPDTNVLKNRFGLRDSEQLKKVEADLSAVLHALEESVYDTGELETVLRCCLHERDAAT